jgi:4-hydroxy-3-methylbut-2-en-1-yl diphosphate reductase
VVAELLIDASGNEVARLGSAPLLAAELRRLGLRARPGTIVSTDHIVTGGERASLSALGADVVDMESTAVASAPWGAPLAVVRAISDTPGRELFSAAGVTGALTALRSLRSSRRALANWAAAARPIANTSKTILGAGDRSSGTDRTGMTASAPAPDDLVHFPPSPGGALTWEYHCAKA